MKQHTGKLFKVYTPAKCKHQLVNIKNKCQLATKVSAIKTNVKSTIGLLLDGVKTFDKLSGAFPVHLQRLRIVFYLCLCYKYRPICT